MKNFRRIILVIIMLFSFNVNVMAIEVNSRIKEQSKEVDFNITSKHAILYNLTSNEVLYELNSEEVTNIASLTKIMGVIVAIENVSDLNEKVTIKREVFNGILGYSQAGFKVGDVVTVRDLLYGVMLPSGADAANALAIHVGGSVDGFIEMMNKKVNELGLENTHFDNPIGMDSDDNYSTASDIAEMLLYGLKSDIFKEIFTSREYTVPGLGLKMKSTLIGYSRSYGLDVTEITGAKSGYTDGAGLCLASTATIDEVDYLLVTIKANTTSRSNAVRDSLRIYDYYSSNYSFQTIVEKEQVLATIPTLFGKEKTFKLKADKDIELYLENNFRKNKLKYEYEGIDKLNYSIKKGDKLGHITVTYRGEELIGYDVYLNEVIEYYHPVLYAVIIIAVIMMIWSLIKIKERKKKSKAKKRGK